MQKNLSEKAVSILFLSALLLAISAPLSIAADNVAIGIGLVGIILYSKQLHFNKLDYRILSVSVIGFISSILSIKPIYSLKNSHYAWHFIPYVVVSRLQKNKIKPLLTVLGVSVSVASLGVIFQAFTGIPPQHIFQAGIRIHLLTHPIRAAGFFDDALTTGGVITPALLLFLGLLIFEKNKSFKVLYMLVIALSGLALIFTMDRAYWLGFALAVLALPLVYKHRISLIITLLFITVSWGIYFSIPMIHQRVQTAIHYKQNPSAIDRLNMWSSALEIYKHYNLRYKLIGCGSGNVSHLLRPYLVKKAKQTYGIKHFKEHIFSAVHNEYLQILVKWGIIGLIIWLYLWIYILLRNITFIKRTENPFSRAVTIGLTLGFIAFLVGGFFEHNVGDAEVIIFIMYLLGINGNILEGEL